MSHVRGPLDFKKIVMVKISNVPWASVVITPTFKFDASVQIKASSKEEAETIKVKTVDGVLLISSDADVQTSRPVEATIQIMVTLPVEAVIYLIGRWALAEIGRFTSNLHITARPGAGRVHAVRVAYADITMHGGEPIAIDSVTGHVVNGPRNTITRLSEDGCLTVKLP